MKPRIVGIVVDKASLHLIQHPRAMSACTSASRGIVLVRRVFQRHAPIGLDPAMTSARTVEVVCAGDINLCMRPLQSKLICRDVRGGGGVIKAAY